MKVLSTAAEGLRTSLQGTALSETALAGGVFSLVQPKIYQYSAADCLWPNWEHWGREVDWSWQVEGVHFSTGEELREEVVFLTVLFWTNLPLYRCISFASVPASHVLGGNCGQVSFSIPQRQSRAWRARTGLHAEELPQRQAG